MAHFAELDVDNMVKQVVVISNDDLLDENGVEQEYIGVFVCNKIFGSGKKWVQTSYNGNFRKRYAGIGLKYDQAGDVFYDPNPPFASWSLDANFDWQPPFPCPTDIIDGHRWVWDESTLAWVSVEGSPPGGIE